MTVYRLHENEPELPDNGDYWIAPGAHVVGNVRIEEGVGIWFGATLRGDLEKIIVGAGSNIQDNCVLHSDPGFPMIVGRGCTVGHKAMLHGCVIGDNTLIGMCATVLNGAVIGKNCLIGAGALVTAGKVIPDGSLVMGSPGKVVRALDDKASQINAASAERYQMNMRRFRDDLQEI